MKMPMVPLAAAFAMISWSQIGGAGGLLGPNAARLIVFLCGNFTLIFGSPVLQTTEHAGLNLPRKECIQKPCNSMAQDPKKNKVLCLKAD